MAAVAKFAALATISAVSTFDSNDPAKPELMWDQSDS